MLTGEFRSSLGCAQEYLGVGSMTTGKEEGKKFSIPLFHVKRRKQPRVRTDVPKFLFLKKRKVNIRVRSLHLVRHVPEIPNNLHLDRPGLAGTISMSFQNWVFCLLIWRYKG